MATRRPSIQFPIVTWLRIANYQLFPGAADPQGSRPGLIEHSFEPGVTVIVGINGLGKTTLLNALFRVLSGPTDWKVRAVDKPAGSSPIVLGDWKAPNYFRRRVGDDAQDAEIAATFTFGKRSLLIQRSLRDLAVKRLEVDGRPLPATESAYREAVVSLSGAGGFEDFFLILRYLVFVLEERPPIVWDPDAQADILRVLFFDREAALRSRELIDRIQSADSRFRNVRVHVRRLEERLNQIQRATREDADQLEFRALQTRVAALEEELKGLEARLEAADADRKSDRLRLEQAKLILEERRQEYGFAEQQHFANVFPDISQVAEYVFVRADGGCLVCGNKTGAAQVHIKARTADHRCPLCNSTPETQERLSGTADASKKRLLELDAAVSQALHDVRALEAALSESVRRHRDALTKLVQARTELVETSAILQERNLLRPPPTQEIEKMDASLRELRSEMARWKEEREAAESDFADVLAQGEQTIQKLHKRISDAFTHFVHDFIAENCDIEYSLDERRIGQEGDKFAFPRFVVRLTSAVSPDQPVRRDATFEVSQSQKEFIDLSFRMALMKVAAGNAPLMLVLETPEASLDALFVARAGKLLGDFARENDGSRVLASSNLTKGEMISALLGTLPKPGTTKTRETHYIPPSRRDKHVIDLLTLAAPNAALRDFGEHYAAEYRRAVYPDRRES